MNIIYSFLILLNLINFIIAKNKTTNNLVVANNNSPQCPNGWTTRTDKDGNVYGYKIIMQDMINYFQARNLCIKDGGEMVSIHSAEEEQFVATLATPLITQCQTNNSVCKQRVTSTMDWMLRTCYIGLNRAAVYPDYDSTVVQTWSDGTTVDYASVPTPGVPKTVVSPWGPGSPSGASDASNQQGFPENCVTMYRNPDDNSINWNDLSCFQKLGCVVCKKQCNNGGQTCGGGTGTNTPTCGKDGWQWAKEGNSGREYRIFNIPSPGNYWQALATCHSNGAKVASYHSDEQKSLLTQMCQSSNCAWIGMHTSPSGIKYWDDGSQNNYQNLLEVSECQKKPKSPSCGGGKGRDNPPSGSTNCSKDCTAVSSSGKTTDQSCTSSCGAVICEKECTPP
ncbi:C-type lectin domain-containing protein [Meloidogyne graminicola]|uniref:C-type lectin domain-containing protein n=1 Tax=Meloidogyne graminicola TaxID=189291 RepID=A0A8S9ZU91_9BILA|nr:C-type lectin domain-containing protein [Meloidogyne graminicola]